MGIQIDCWFHFICLLSLVYKVDLDIFEMDSIPVKLNS